MHGIKTINPTCIHEFLNSSDEYGSLELGVAYLSSKKRAWERALDSFA